MAEVRVVAFLNRHLGAQAAQHLGRRLVAAVLHPEPRRHDADLLQGSLPSGLPCFLGGGDPHQLADDLRRLQPSHGVSVLYGYLLPACLRRLFPHGIANLHPSLLPHGRGAHPNAWALARREPAGVSLHLIDAGIDTGPLLAQMPVPVQPHDTAATLYARLLATAESCLPAWLDAFLAGTLIPQPQPAGPPARRVTDLESLRLDPDRTYTGRELIDLLRARSFPPHAGALYEVDGHRLRLRLELSPEDPA